MAEVTMTRQELAEALAERVMEFELQEIEGVGLYFNEGGWPTPIGPDNWHPLTDAAHAEMIAARMTELGHSCLETNRPGWGYEPKNDTDGDGYLWFVEYDEEQCFLDEHVEDGKRSGSLIGSQYFAEHSSRYVARGLAALWLRTGKRYTLIKEPSDAE